jgi:hypothetical protein
MPPPLVVFHSAVSATGRKQIEHYTALLAPIEAIVTAGLVKIRPSSHNHNATHAKFRADGVTFDAALLMAQ